MGLTCEIGQGKKPVNAVGGEKGERHNILTWTDSRTVSVRHDTQDAALAAYQYLTLILFLSVFDEMYDGVIETNHQSLSVSAVPRLRSKNTKQIWNRTNWKQPLIALLAELILIGGIPDSIEKFSPKGECVFPYSLRY